MGKGRVPSSCIARRERLGAERAEWGHLVICIRCGSENAPSFRFCGNCGTQLGQACPACGFQNFAESKFCGGCGARLQEVQAEDAQGERRQLTVLFCDVVGATALSQLLDPEDLRELIICCQKVCGDAVVAHEGHVAQYLGDGVVMYFGYPRSHEDEAQRAVRCGLEILKGVEAVRDSGSIPPEVSLDVRLGAHTGRVVMGPVGVGDRRDQIALGDTPNIAARIQCEAEPGTLLVSEVTWRIVEGYFTGKCLGEWQLKGVSEPMRLWLVTGESSSRERIEVASILTPFVGREREQYLLEQAWEDSRSGHSRFVLLRGDPGMGKSRLARVFCDQVQFQAADLLVMRTTPYDTNSPFHPVIQLIERKFRLEHTQTPAERLDRTEEGLRSLGIAETEEAMLLASLLSISTGDRYPPSELSPVRRRTRTLELLVEFITAIARTGPTLLLVEDLHWADTSTLEFLELLVTTASDMPLLGLFTARGEFDLRWAGAPALRTIELTRFQPAEVEAMVRGAALGKTLPSEVLRQIVMRSDGVPLFIEELTRSILDSGVLAERAVSWEAVGPVAVEIPATVDASLTSRIDRLGASRATAQLAATIGREFSFELLHKVSERDEATLRQDLKRLLQSGLAWSADDKADTFVFKHALIRDAAYNSLLRSTRQRYHSRIAAALRERFADETSTRPDLIAGHLTAAGEDEDAVAFWEAAGQQALARTAVHEAAKHFQQAIDCLARLPATIERQERELEIQILLAPLLMAIYGWGAVEVEQACTRALGLAQDLERHDLSFAPRWGLWTNQFLRGELVPALGTAETVFQMARASGVRMLEMLGRHALAYTLVYRGEFDRTLEEAEAGLALYDQLALYDPQREKEIADSFGVSSVVSLLACRAHSLWMLGRVEEAEEDYDRMLQIARELGHPVSLANALAFSLHGAFRYAYAGQMDRLTGIADELMALVREENFYLWYAVSYTYQGLIAEALGDEQRARTQMLEGLELFARTGSRLTLVMMNVLCAEALYRLGDDDEAFRRLDVAEADIARREGLLAPDIWRVRGRLLARRGEQLAAEAAYHQAIERAQAQHALSLELRAGLDLHELCAQDGRAEEGRTVLAGVLARFTQGFDRPELARASAIVRAPT
jgi:class 3 adenylate cyclase/tetratricopeptide (TPR) repeat protein